MHQVSVGASASGRGTQGTARRLRARRRTVSSPVSQDVLEDLQIERLIRDEALEATMLFVEHSQPLGFVHLEIAVALLPVVERGRATPRRCAPGGWQRSDRC